MSVRPRTLLVASLLVLLAVAEAKGQCALCRESLRKSGNQGLIEGIYLSILMLVFMPTVLIVGIGVLLRRAYVAKQRAESRPIPEPSPCART
jgi:hypothetical protein